MAPVSLAQLLAARDARKALLEGFFASGLPSLVVATMNIPGSVKSSALICRAFDLALQDLLVELGSGQLLLLCKEAPATGPYAVFSIAEGIAARSMKRQLTAFEDDHPIGRWLDLDVWLEDGTSLGRKELGMKPRRCFLCGEPALSCRRNATHTIGELRAFTKEHLQSYVSNSGLHRPINP
jgi:holo-ACP synthase